MPTDTVQQTDKRSFESTIAAATSPETNLLRAFNARVHSSPSKKRVLVLGAFVRAATPGPPKEKHNRLVRPTWAKMRQVVANFRQDGPTEAQHGPTWAQLGPILGPTWATFGVVLGILVVWPPVLLFSSLRALILLSSPLLLCFVFDVVHKAGEAKSTVKTEAKTAFSQHRLQGKGCSTARKTMRREPDHASFQ